MARRVFLFAFAIVWLVAFGAAPAQAFTLVAPTVKAYVNPKAGWTTSWVQVRATATFQATCGGASSITFRFYFDSAALLTRTVTSCWPWDTGYSAYLKPPVAPTTGNHKVLVNVFSSGSASPIGSGSVAYPIYALPTSPQSATSPSPSLSPLANPPQDPTQSSSPTQSACAITGALPPPSTGSVVDTFIAGAMVASVLPIAGFALFGAGPLLALARRRRLLQLLGLAILVAATLSCAPTTAPTANASPSTWPSACTGA